MDNLTLKAHAKLNLTFDILGKMENGFHKIESVMHEISLHDVVELRELKGDKIKLICNIKQLENEKNIVFKSAKLLKEKFNVKKGVEIKIDKNIPVGGGLGGGSSDAACVLKGLNRLWGLNLSNLVIINLAAEIGTDVPFFINGGTAFAFNKGEMIEKVEFGKKLNFIIINKGIKVDTKYAYSIVDVSKTGEMKATQKMLEAIKSNKNISGLLHNDFEQIIFPRYPEIEKAKEDLIKQGADNALLTGSGATVFGIFSDKGKIKNAFEILKKKYSFVYLSQSV